MTDLSVTALERCMGLICLLADNSPTSSHWDLLKKPLLDRLQEKDTPIAVRVTNFISTILNCIVIFVFLSKCWVKPTVMSSNLFKRNLLVLPARCTFETIYLNFHCLFS